VNGSSATRAELGAEARHTVATRVISLSDFSYGSRATPRSVMIGVTNQFGVTSNAGFSTFTPIGATGWPRNSVTSVEARFSMGISPPCASVKASVETGAGT
jgi:hypothetical protein